MNTLKIFLTTSAIFIICAGAYAQVSSASVRTRSQQKYLLKINRKINYNKTRLAKMENDLDKKIVVMKNAAADAQTAVDNNTAAISALADNLIDKSLARRADNAAHIAKMNENIAHTAANNVSNLQKEIELLKDIIADDADKLVMNAGVYVLP